MQKQLGTGEATKAAPFERLRVRLRAIMPRVAIVAAVLFIARNLLAKSVLFGSNPVGQLLRAVTFIVVGFTLAYYGYKALRWLKRRLLWRVRRRLVVTYLFVGLTPIILLALLGLLSAFGGSSQGMARIVTTQLNETEKQALNTARGLALEAKLIPGSATDKQVQEWLDLRAALIRQVLPGARFALWRGAPGTLNGSLGNVATPLISEISDPQTIGVGDDRTPIGAALPTWLRGKDEWSGLAFARSVGDSPFATPSFRALTRTTAADRQYVVLISVPISKALVQRYQENSEIVLHPYFTANSMVVNNRGMTLQVSDSGGANRDGPAPTEEQIRAEAEKRAAEARKRRDSGQPFADQFGQPLGNQMYFVVHPAADWSNGESDQHLAFFFDWSWALASKQFLGTSNFGGLWWTLLKIVGLVFLVFELLALIAAVWMTRAVTGTVHKLYVATQYFKRGEFSHRIKVRSRDQLGELAMAFNDMSANIEVLLQERVEREKLEREVEIAAEVQARLFPSQVPDLLTVEIAAECRAARGVAGDYYDYVEIAPGVVALALGDVSGKGMSASLVMANLQASMRSQAAITAERLGMAQRAVAAAANTSGDLVLARVVADADIDGAISRHATNINRQLCASTDTNRFATLLLSIYEDRTRTLRYTNAGHNPPILVHADSTIERLTEGGMMVGAFDFAKYDEASVTIGVDDVLVIFSDGLSEAEHFSSEEEFGEDRLLAFAVEHRAMSAHDLRNAIFAEVDRWSGAKERGDDQTLLIVKGEKWCVVGQPGRHEIAGHS
ncbi:MAG: SpoIIE family protein phosphatase [Pyrinomonadaceae bacterium]